jgi:hypothetical protein
MSHRKLVAKILSLLLISNFEVLILGSNLDGQLQFGHRIVTAAEHDKWKATHNEMHVEVQCSVEEIIVQLKGVLPHTLFKLNDPYCRLMPIDRDTQQIKIKPPTACGSSLEINSTHLSVFNEISSSIATGAEPVLFSGNVGCVFGEQELRTSLYFDSPAIPMLNDAHAGQTWTPVKTYSGTGDSLIWAQMALYKDKSFREVFTSPPSLKTTQHIYVGITLLRTPEEESYLLVKDCWAIPNDYSDVRLQLVTNGCMDQSLVKEGIQFNLANNGNDYRVRFQVPVFKFVGSDHVYLQCQVRACLRRTCRPTCNGDAEEVMQEYNEYETITELKTVVEELELVDEEIEAEIIYESEPDGDVEAEIIYEEEDETRETAKQEDMPKSESLHGGPHFSELSSLRIKIIEDQPVQVERKLDPISLLLLSVLVASIISLIGIIIVIIDRRKRLSKQHQIQT